MSRERSGAEELFERIVADGWAGLEAWRVDGRAEDFLLEFKGRGHAAPKLNEFDRANIGHAASAFTNASGGVLIIGAVTQKQDGVDCLLKLDAAPSLKAYAGAIDAHLALCTDPRVPGARVAAIPTSDGADEGVVAILFPPSDGVHRAKSAGEHSDKYFQRIGAQTLVLEHGMLADRFGRRPSPKLILRIAPATDSSAYFGIWVRNVGRGIARDVFLRVGAFGGDPDLRTPHKRVPCEDDGMYCAESWQGVVLRRDTRDYGIRSVVLSPPPLFSGDESLAVRYRYSDFNCFRIVARVDADEMQPVSVSALWTPFDEATLDDDGKRQINLFSEEA